MNNKFERERAKELAEKEVDLKQAAIVTEKEKAQDQAVKESAQLDKQKNASVWLEQANMKVKKNEIVNLF